MKKIVTITRFLCMVLSLVACGKVEISMKEIYEAGQVEAMLQNHQSVSVQDAMDGKVWTEKYLTKEYSYAHYPDEEFNYAEFMTDDANYVYSSGDYLRYLFIAPDGVTNDFSSERAELYASVLNADIVDETIESISKKDGHITVKSLLDEEILAAEDGLASGKTEYALDAKNGELISVTSEYAYEDGTAFHVVTEVAYDTEATEMIEVFLKYANQTDDLRNVTVVSNPGTEKKVSQNFQIPKGLIIGFTWDDAFEDKVELYSDAACTKAYDPYADTDSDLTVYVKWAE